MVAPASLNQEISVKLYVIGQLSGISSTHDCVEPEGNLPTVKYQQDDLCCDISFSPDGIQFRRNAAFVCFPMPVLFKLVSQIAEEFISPPLQADKENAAAFKKSDL